MLHPVPVLRHLTILVLVTAASGLRGEVARAADDFIWWEGENPKETNFPARSSFTPVDAKERSHLSGEAWLSADGGRLGQPPLFARYEIKVTRAGNYAFWTRKFWKHGPFKWRFDNLYPRVSYTECTDPWPGSALAHGR